MLQRKHMQAIKNLFVTNLIFIFLLGFALIPSVAQDGLPPYPLIENYREILYPDAFVMRQLTAEDSTVSYLIYVNSITDIYINITKTDLSGSDISPVIRVVIKASDGTVIAQTSGDRIGTFATALIPKADWYYVELSATFTDTSPKTLPYLITLTGTDYSIYRLLELDLEFINIPATFLLESVDIPGLVGSRIFYAFLNSGDQIALEVEAGDYVWFSELSGRPILTNGPVYISESAKWIQITLDTQHGTTPVEITLERVRPINIALLSDLATVTPTLIPSRTLTPSITPTASDTPRLTSTFTPTFTYTPTPTSTPTLTMTNTVVQSNTPLPRPTRTPTRTRTATARPRASSTPLSSMSCPNTLRSRLRPGDTARVTLGGQNNRVRAGAGTGYEQVGSLSPGAVFAVVDGPSCANGYAWYRIRAGALVGWTAESDGAEYWLELFDESSPRLLDGGRGLTTGLVLNDGAMQIEGYCTQRGYGTRRNNSNWFCTSGNQDAFRLEQSDFNRICQLTYNRNDAFAVQDGSSSTPAFRWRCYGSGN